MIDTRAIRNRILDLALHGQLTKQNLVEGTGETLFNQIQKEKNQLIVKGEIKKSQAYSKSNAQKAPYKLPNSWKWVRLGEVLNEVIVPQRDKPKVFDGDIPWCRIEDADGDYMSYSHSGQNVSQEVIDRMNLRVFPKGTVLSACSGASIGRILITTTELCTNQTFNGLVCNRGLYNWYLLYFLRNSISRLKRLGGGSAMAYISQKKIGEMMIPLPPLAEQKRIVEKVNSLFSILDTIDELQARYASDWEVLKSKLIDAAIRGKLTKQLPEDGTAEELYQQIQEEKAKLIKEKKIKPEKILPSVTAEEKTFEIPNNWSWVRLRQICTKLVDGDHNPPRGLKEKTEYFMISSQNINNNTLVDLSKVRYLSKDVFDLVNQRTNAEEGDIFLTTVGSLGRSCVFDGSLNVSFQRSVSVIRTLIDNFYLKYYFDSPYFQKLINRESSGTAQRGFYLNQLAMTPIPIPPLAEQKRIVELLNSFMDVLPAEE